MKKAAVVVTALLLASLALTACGGSDSSDSSSSAETSAESGQSGGSGEATGKSAGSASSVDIEAAPGSDLAFTADSATAKAGAVTVNFTNPQALSHDVDVEDDAGEEIGGTDLVAEGAASTKVDLKPGTYTYFCSVPGHREAGMEGTLTVR